MDYMQCVTFSFHTSVFFLMQCFWNYLSNNVAKKSFMSSFEFKFYILWALGSMAMFPVLQWRFRNDELLSEVVPQFAYGGEVLITACLGIRSNFRFKRIIAGAKRSQNSSHVSVVNRLTYFKEMNFFLTIGLFSYGASFVILCADGLTPSMTINSNKLATDILICNANMCVVIIWLLFISIFHPRRHYAANNALSSRTGGPESYERSKNDVEMTTTAPGSQQRLSQRVTNFVANNSHQPSAENGVFMRSMAPMHVDYPASVSTETAPLTHSAASPGGSVQGRKISVEDPYSSQSVLFSMVDPRYPSSQLQAPRYPSPMSDVSAYHTREPSPLVSQVPTVSQYDTRSAYGDIANDYHDDTTAQARPPPPLPATAEAEQPGRERMVTDWLWQSPSGRKQT
ncbi:hypothetical protein BCR43DRAFT_435997 [Syncephalastrum racemosum]|uniref:Uncharacterized protein n=1 Tax=Syncephalastrum racemosum TaxID=13706 RepID=A0A1X2HJ14_SYNRA|nr:hypothetical protein BCR43DRAFT_435997 [Syncephalastrum racemosum]